MTELTDEELNKRIHEITGLCIHAYQDAYTHTCRTCGRFDAESIDFTKDWQGFGLMWEFMWKYPKRDKFRNFVWHEEIGFCDWADDITDAYAWPQSIISPRSFAVAMCEFFKEAKTEGG